ncbi:MAG: FIST C-terminal domain-containing protein [Gammaproteobacteria bacterium]|nr:FIST C-terminal domain-containing protein [Gammaproteobacteria bacterium]MCI0591411.1 FIST C-terminal domain-containing protein [Gammaproteobacteria bacterium]
MEAFRFGHASAGSWQEAAKACLSQTGRSASTANLGFLYVTDWLAPHLSEILVYLKNQCGIQHWVGTVGMGICATGCEYYDCPAMAIMLSAFPEDAFRIFGTPNANVARLELFHPPEGSAVPTPFGIVHGDPRNGHVPDLVVQLAQAMESGFLVGGLTSSRGEFPQIADILTSGGISGVLFSPDVVVSTRLTQGCSPIGKRHTITACDGNILISLDGQPALEVFKDDIGEVLSHELETIGGYIFVGLPVAGADTGDYLVRHIVGVDVPNKLLAIGASAVPGSDIMFCRRDADTAYQDLLRMLEEIRPDKGIPKGGVYYSCIGRGRAQFGPDSRELKTVQEALGNIPLVGFYANGEISNNRLYGYTGVLTLFL